MSDFIFSSRPRPQGELTAHIQSIYMQDAPSVTEFHGAWGSLGVSRNLYNGFQPIETDHHICAMIGGPVLYFRDNAFLTGSDPTIATQAIYNRWTWGKMQWDEDLSGPFVALLINKTDNKVIFITDLMMFIPVYQCDQNNTLMLGSHVDALARAADQANLLDPVSLVDFILNCTVTYPYTSYQNIRQCHPAAIHSFQADSNGNYHAAAPQAYWVPEEKFAYPSLDHAAIALSKGLQGFVERVTETMDEVAQFVSGGEDSRFICGLLPPRLKRDSFIFLDSMNREGQIARKVASAYRVSFHPEIRSHAYYLDILPEATTLIGSGNPYIDAHSLGFYKKCRLDQYPAVFGGYLSDSFIKGMYTRKMPLQINYPFIPEFFLTAETHTKPLKNAFFADEVLRLIDQRRADRVDIIRQLRPNSTHEWFSLWPTSMLFIPYFYCNRYLFKTYEPFMGKESVKIGASVPTTWKLNRRLFNKMARPFLAPSRNIFHGDGYLPYYPWWVNTPIKFLTWALRRMSIRTGLIKGHQGPWGDWEKLMKSEKWKNTIETYHQSLNKNKEALFLTRSDILASDASDLMHKVNLLQVLWFLEGRHPEKSAQ